MRHIVSRRHGRYAALVSEENLQVRLASRPDGRPSAGNFSFTREALPAPEAFIGMLEGRNFGKLLVRVS
jgi:hypothetical protein